MWAGKLLSIHIAEAAGEPMREVQTATLLPGRGIEGDRYETGTGKYTPFPDIREVTLMEVETLEALRRDHGIDLAADEHRRNLTTQDVPLNHLVGKRFSIGPVVLEGGRLNAPCRYFELLTGKKDVYRYLLHRSGLNCRIIEGGIVAPEMAMAPL